MPSAKHDLRRCVGWIDIDVSERLGDWYGVFIDLVRGEWRIGDSIGV
jgi:hypothetical protein